MERTGTCLLESQRFGITGSGEATTTNGNSSERAAGIKAGRVAHALRVTLLEDLSRLSFSQIDAAVTADNGKEKATGDDEVSSGEICEAVEAAHNWLPKVISR